VIVALLPVLDDFDRALKAMGTTSDVNAIKEGVALVQHKLKNILSQKGLKEMESKGTTFDADLHEAITNIPAPSDDLKGKVVDELEKGYYLNDKVVRFAKVVVAAIISLKSY
jgi:molecular chaperone GrpE